ncbi:MAG: hypothetical protein ACC656_14550, partial [Candidatus Heimdallarchaeota archaeon]
GLPDDRKLSVLPTDTDENGIPNELSQANILDATGSFTTTGSPPTIMLTGAMYYMRGTEADSVTVKVGDVTYPYDAAAGPESWSRPVGTEDEFNSLVINAALTGGSPQTIFDISTKQFVYFKRTEITDEWLPQTDSSITRQTWYTNSSISPEKNKREYGRYPLNFAWLYTTPRFHLVDPAASNIIDVFITTAGYYQGITRWLENKSEVKPDEPTPLDLRTAYDSLLQNSMISDTVILQPGKFKILFGTRALPELRATFKIIRPTISNLTDNEVKVKIVNIIKSFFTISDWDFGSTFFFTELASIIHTELGTEISSVVLVPTFITHQFGDLFQVISREDEIFIADISTESILRPTRVF